MYRSSEEYTDLLFGLNTPGCKVKAVSSYRCGRNSSSVYTYYHQSGSSFGISDWLRKSDLLNLLDSEGTLTIEVDIDIYVPRREKWYPEIVKDVPLWSELYDEHDETNVELDVQGKCFRLHTAALKLQAPGLYEYIKEFEGKGPVPLAGIDNDTFAFIHQYIYTVLDVDAEGLWDSLQKAESILIAADKFGCTSLKLYAESVIVEKFLMPETCAALLVMADSHSCPLLKEAAKDMYKAHSVAVLGSDDWKNLMMNCPKLLNELLCACSVKSCSYEEDKVETWDVPMLRKKLQEAKLDLDGTKEMLVKRWKVI